MAARSFCVCLCDRKGSQPECGTVVVSKKRARKNQDPGAWSNACYCHRWHKHNQNWGQLVQQVMQAYEQLKTRLEQFLQLEQQQKAGAS